METEVVLLEWVVKLPLRQQSAIIAALRGPDTYAPNMKAATRWLRRTTQRDAEPGHSYMQTSGVLSVEEIASELEYVTVHYATHVLQALEIIGYKHPKKSTADIAINCYEQLARRVFNLGPETEGELEARLGTISSSEF